MSVTRSRTCFAPVIAICAERCNRRDLHLLRDGEIHWQVEIWDARWQGNGQVTGFIQELDHAGKPPKISSRDGRVPRAASSPSWSAHLR
jgi:hypothetical protein